MKRLRINTILHDKVLVSRESARLLEQALRAAIAEAPASDGVVVDFEGVAGIAPSFMDELLTMFDEVMRGADGHDHAELVVANPPMRLSLKFEAVARGHGMSVRPRDDGSWVLTSAA